MTTETYEGGRRSGKLAEMVAECKAAPNERKLAVASKAEAERVVAKHGGRVVRLTDSREDPPTEHWLVSWSTDGWS